MEEAAKEEEVFLSDVIHIQWMEGGLLLYERQWRIERRKLLIPRKSLPEGIEDLELGFLERGGLSSAPSPPPEGAGGGGEEERWWCRDGEEGGEEERTGCDADLKFKIAVCTTSSSFKYFFST